jgi:hypothetical protein
MHDEHGRGAFFVPHDLTAPLAGSESGPLAGLTAAVKDMYDIAGSRTGAGNPTWLATHAPARAHAAAVAKILAAGATIVGKTICDELFFSVAGINAHYGTPANLRAPGGSRAARRADRPPPPPPAPATSRWAATPAARSASQLRFAASMA